MRAQEALFFWLCEMSSNLYRENIINVLKYGNPPGLSPYDAFGAIIGDEYEAIAAQYGCEVSPITINLMQAQDLWVQDIDNLGVIDSDEPDHLKHAGWLCHWLRKKKPIGELTIRDESKLTATYEKYYNDVTAFIIGLRVALFHECCRLGYSDEDIVELLAKHHYSDILHDVSVYLHHKNVSPHALYLIYRSLIQPSPFIGPL